MAGLLRTWWAFLRQFIVAWLALDRSTRKLAALLWHIIKDIPDIGDHSLLRVVLMAYLCEVEYYRFYGETMTGAPWIYGQEGPVPEELPNAIQWLLNRELVTLDALPPCDVRGE